MIKDNSKSHLGIVTIFIIPLIITILAIQLKKATGPYWLGVNSDPSYIYLMNSLYLVNGITPIFVDHPGITLQMLGALVVKALHWNIANNTIPDRVFSDPEYYLNAIHFVLLFSYIASLIAVGLYAFKRTKNIVFSLFVQTASFLFLTVIPMMVNVNAEAVLITVLNLYILCVLKLYFDFEGEAHNRSMVLFGMVCALGVATKITFLPLLIGPFILYRGLRAKLVFGFSFLISWFILTIPIIPRYGKMFHWWSGLIVYTGTHGSGERGFINIGRYTGSLWNLIRVDSFLFAIVVCCLMIVLWGIKSQHKRDGSVAKLKKILRFLSVFSLIVVAQFLMAAKQGYVHYTTPAVGLVGLLACLLLEYVNTKFKVSDRFSMTLLSIFIVIFCFSAVRYADQLSKRNNEIYRFSKMIYEKYKGCIICGYYRSSSPLTAMDFGDDCYGFKAYGQALQSKFPDACFYNRWNHLFHRFSDYVYPQDLLKNNPCVLLYGDSAVFPEYLQLKEIESSPHEKLYKILSTTAEEAVKYYLVTKSLEAKHQYSEAYRVALKAKSAGFPMMDEYIAQLRSLIEKNGASSSQYVPVK